jgi:RNA recognition motif. (a.k.a. RRM, RBD, or RNP domain)
MSYHSGFKPSSTYAGTATTSPPPAASLPARPPPPENPYPANYTSSRGGWQTTTYPSSSSAGYYSQQAHNGYTQPPAQAYASGGAAGGKAYGQDYDPEAAAQLQQWQSAYVNKDDASKNGNPAATPIQAPIGPRPTIGPVLTADDMDSAEHDEPAAALPTTTSATTVVRSGGGKTWQDPSLVEWNPDHARLFIGNLAGEVTDESLFKAFSKYPSLVKARVVRDKRTTKSKGFGFVSFTDSNEYFRAAREMEGKYIGSHPVQIKPADKFDVVSKSKAEARLRGKHKKAKKDRVVRDGEQEAYQEYEYPAESEYAGEYQTYMENPTKAAEVVAPQAPVTKIAGHANTGAGVKKNKKDKGRKDRDRKDKVASAFRVLG